MISSTLDYRRFYKWESPACIPAHKELDHAGPEFVPRLVVGVGDDRPASWTASGKRDIHRYLSNKPIKLNPIQPAFFNHPTPSELHLTEALVASDNHFSAVRTSSLLSTVEQPLQGVELV